jgi:hypothetical protein
MAIDFSIDGISFHAGATNISLTIDDLAGLGIDLDLDIPLNGGGFPFAADSGTADAGPDGELESLLGQFTPGAPLFAADDGADSGAGTAEANTFDPATLASLTLLGGADDPAATDGSIDPLTGA